MLELTPTKDWYNQNECILRQIIHIMIYGMCRDGMNVWFIKVCDTWQEKYQIQEHSTTKTHKGRGVVALNMQWSASGKI